MIGTITFLALALTPTPQIRGGLQRQPPTELAAPAPLTDDEKLLFANRELESRRQRGGFQEIEEGEWFSARQGMVESFGEIVLGPGVDRVDFVADRASLNSTLPTIPNKPLTLTFRSAARGFYVVDVFVTFPGNAPSAKFFATSESTFVRSERTDRTDRMAPAVTNHAGTVDRRTGHFVFVVETRGGNTGSRGAGNYQVKVGSETSWNLHRIEISPIY